MRSARAIVMVGAAAILLTFPAAGAPRRMQRDPRAERVIEALLIWRLVDELNLSDQQIARIFPRIKALKELRIHLGIRKVLLQRELRQLLAQQPRDEERIRVKIAELDDLRMRIEQERQRVLRDIHAALAVEQQAQFTLIQETFEAETIRTLEEVRQIVEEQRRRQ